MIQKNQLWAEFEELSPAAQREVASLISRIRDESQTSARQRPATRQPISDDGFFGIWRDREEMSDSTEWVRRMRREQWGGH